MPITFEALAEIIIKGGRLGHLAEDQPMVSGRLKHIKIEDCGCNNLFPE